MKVQTGIEAYYAGIGVVHRVRVMRPVMGARGVVRGWSVAGVNEPIGLLDPVSKYDLYDNEQAATKAAFVKKLRGK